MSMEGRPSVQRKHTRASEAKREDRMDLGVSLTVDGTEYVVREGDMTALDTMMLRRETGLSFVEILINLNRSPDIDLVAALVWLARRQRGEQTLPYMAVATQINYDSEIEVVEDEPGPESDPEA